MLERLTARGVRPAAQDAAAEPEGRAGRARRAGRSSGSTRRGAPRRYRSTEFVALARALSLASRAASGTLGRPALALGGGPLAIAAASASRRGTALAAQRLDLGEIVAARAHRALGDQRLALPAQRADDRWARAAAPRDTGGSPCPAGRCALARPRPSATNAPRLRGSTASAVSSRSVAPSRLPAAARRAALRQQRHRARIDLVVGALAAAARSKRYSSGQRSGDGDGSEQTHDRLQTGHNGQPASMGARSRATKKPSVRVVRRGQPHAGAARGARRQIGGSAVQPGCPRGSASTCPAPSSSSSEQTI